MNLKRKFFTEKNPKLSSSNVACRQLVVQRPLCDFIYANFLRFPVAPAGCLHYSATALVTHSKNRKPKKDDDDRKMKTFFPVSSQITKNKKIFEIISRSSKEVN